MSKEIGNLTRLYSFTTLKHRDSSSMKTQMGTYTSDSDVSFQQSFTYRWQTPGWENRLFGCKKPSITISVIISFWPRPHSNQVINTHIILLKEIEKCIPDCQREEFSVIYAKVFLEHFFLRHPSWRNTNSKYFMNPEVLLASIWRWSWEYKSVIIFHHRTQLSEHVINTTRQWTGGRQEAYS